MKNWTEGDVIHLLSARDPLNIATICDLLNQAPGAFDAMQDGHILKSMTRARISGRFPTFTPKQTDFAASIISRRANRDMIGAIAGELNFREQRGNPVPLGSNVPPAGTKPEADPDEVRRIALAIVAKSTTRDSVTREEVAEPEYTGSEWGMF